MRLREARLSHCGSHSCRFAVCKAAFQNLATGKISRSQSEHIEKAAGFHIESATPTYRACSCKHITAAKPPISSVPDGFHPPKVDFIAKCRQAPLVDSLRRALANALLVDFIAPRRQTRHPPFLFVHNLCKINRKICHFFVKLQLIFLPDCATIVMDLNLY